MILEGGEMGEIIRGQFTRRVVSPEVKQRILTTATKRRWEYKNKENVNSITGLVTGQYSSQRKRRSPLPDWYPRAPLRDISAICKAIEKRNLLKDESSSSSQKPKPSLSLSLNQHQTPKPTNQIPPLKPDLMALDLTPIKILYTPEMEAYEKKLTESIEKLEKIVKRNLKRERKMNTACVSKRDARVRTLMSMR